MPRFSRVHVVSDLDLDRNLQYLILGLTQVGEKYFEDMDLEDLSAATTCHDKDSCGGCLLRLMLYLIRPTTNPKE